MEQGQSRRGEEEASLSGGRRMEATDQDRHNGEWPRNGCGRHMGSKSRAALMEARWWTMVLKEWCGRGSADASLPTETDKSSSAVVAIPMSARARYHSMWMVVLWSTFAGPLVASPISLLSRCVLWPHPSQRREPWGQCTCFGSCQGLGAGALRPWHMACLPCQTEYICTYSPWYGLESGCTTVYYSKYL